MVEVQYLWRSRIGHALVADWVRSRQCFTHFVPGVARIRQIVSWLMSSTLLHSIWGNINAVVILQEESAVYLEASQGVVSFKDASTGYLQPIRLVSSYTAGDSPLHFGIVRDDLRQYFVAVYAHG